MGVLVLLIPCFLVLFCSSTPVSCVATNGDDKFLKCLFPNPQDTSNIPLIPVYTQSNASYSTLFRSSARNRRYLSSPNNSRKPKFLVLPSHESHVQAAVICCKKHGLDLKVRSGGHDVEGLSYTSSDIDPFILVDLINYRNITVNVEDRTAWVQAGATIGELYYRVGEKSSTLGFPAGFCPTVGVGGHFSGGGLGALVRKYGAAADQIIDAEIVNVEGKILSIKTMRNDLFWAIRGGGAASFGVVLSWKVKLVPVPPIVTAAMVERTLEQGATDLVHKWQFIADRLPEDIYIGLNCTVVNSNATSERRTVRVIFSILFLGNVDELLRLMEENFQELGLQQNDCTEMSWLESNIYFYYTVRSPLELLLDRDPMSKIFTKAKSDHVMVPMPKEGLEGLWRMLFANDKTVLKWTPYGGKMNEISESAIPFPHRIGNIYNILYQVDWVDGSETEKHLEFMKKLYNFLTPYVSMNPRTTYLNYLDLDLGQNDWNVGEVMAYRKAKVWGTKYFKSNFERLVLVKTEVDPGNFFKSIQSIPPSHHCSQLTEEE
ncbi:hypothetical protein MKW98_005619 [Papaver atlanticum]|uniref:FAD-binding PCMH-type domain-containing protein n=1 Tax=Papaver atlanticum TaxID=357466 RepID=A0AAD4XKB1_9MAGN|nr:hypothetical protein MKW98_005619 [Papaver atlanticum]